MSMLPGGRRKKHFQGKFGAPITLISSGDPDIRSLDLVHGEERRADSDHREGRVGDVVRCHLSDNYWPGRPMRGGGVKANLPTFLWQISEFLTQISYEFRDVSINFSEKIVRFRKIIHQNRRKEQRNWLKITTKIANIEKATRFERIVRQMFAGNLRAERCESMEIL